MKNEIVKIESKQLEKVVTESGLAIQEGEEIKKSYLPFLVQLSEIQSQATKINFDSPAEIDETIARELRLKTVKIRTGSKELKDERKKGYLLRGNLEQAAYNLIEASCKITEDVFNNVEKAREIAEKKRKEQLRIDREEKLSPYTESVVMCPLGEMSEEQFSELYTGLRTAHEIKLEAEKKAEEERLAAIEAERIKQENIRLENERLKKEAEEKEKALQAERERIRKDNEEKERLAEIERKKNAKRNEELRPYIIFIRDYSKMLSLDEKTYQKEFADIQRGAKEHYEFEAQQKAKADKERAELLAKAEAERKEKERLETEIKAKKEAEEKAKRDAELKIQADEKARKAEEKRAKLAPDKTKLLNFMQAINDLPRPEVKSIEAANIAASANVLLIKVANYIRDNADKL